VSHPADARLCGKPTKTGGVCGQVLGDSSRECIWHGEGVSAEDRTAIARLGGRRLRTLPPETTVPADVFTAKGLLRRLQLIEHSVVTGQLAPEVAKAAAYTLSVAKSVVELAVHAKIREIEERLEERERPRLPGEWRIPA
jgi:hypothetical protein